METVAERVKYARARKAWSQKELAEAVGLSAVQVSRIEGGISSPQAATLRKLAEVLSVSVAWLSVGEESK